jgi:hypothetical protein
MFLSRSEKNLLVIGAVLLIGSGILYYIMPSLRVDLNKGDAAGNVVINLQPTSPVVSPGATFTINVTMDTGVHTVAAAEIEISYPTNLLQVTAIEKATYLPIELMPGTISGGKAKITLGSQPTAPRKGSGIIAVLIVKALQVQNSGVLQVTSNSQVAAVDTPGNVLGTRGTTSITVGTSTATPMASGAQAELKIDNALSSARQQLDTFTFVAKGLNANRNATRWVRSSTGQNTALTIRVTDSSGGLTWEFRADCSYIPGIYTVWVVDDAGRQTNTVTQIVNAHSSCLAGVTPGQFGLKEGDMISASGSADPDIYIINQYGFKRLFLNPKIFSFYGHLGGYSKVKSVSTQVRDAFKTSVLFTNCETNDGKVYAVQVVGEDEGILHEMKISREQALAADPNYVKKTFCINNNEFFWYPLSSPYTSLSQIPVYQR